MVAQVVSLEEILGTRDRWNLALSAYIILVFVCFLPYTWLPESPKYLYIVAGKRDEARKGMIGMQMSFVSFSLPFNWIKCILQYYRVDAIASG